MVYYFGRGADVTVSGLDALSSLLGRKEVYGIRNGRIYLYKIGGKVHVSRVGCTSHLRSFVMHIFPLTWDT